MKTTHLNILATGLVGVVLLVGGLVLGIMLGSPQKANERVIAVPLPPVAQGMSLKQVEAHLDFGHTRRLAVPCWPGYRCSEWDGKKMKDGRHSYALIYVEPEARQSVRPPIKRSHDE